MRDPPPPPFSLVNPLQRPHRRTLSDLFQAGARLEPVALSKSAVVESAPPPPPAGLPFLYSPYSPTTSYSPPLLPEYALPPLVLPPGVLLLATPAPSGSLAKVRGHEVDGPSLSKMPKSAKKKKERPSPTASISPTSTPPVEVATPSSNFFSTPTCPPPPPPPHPPRTPTAFSPPLAKLKQRPKSVDCMEIDPYDNPGYHPYDELRFQPHFYENQLRIDKEEENRGRDRGPRILWCSTLSPWVMEVLDREHERAYGCKVPRLRGRGSKAGEKWSLALQDSRL